jgi:hypothetical protein
MAAPGLAAFQARDASRTAKYSFERESAQFDAAQLKAFKANRKAWAFFEAQPPYYRKLMVHFVVSAKREETRHTRLAQLIATSAAGRRMPLV